ncbi:hypothetical protein V7S43_013089 [Phytophthora oleae]|uniref:Uncharacterized protein n=1 Tax=Phytophthora oleae TaxID=2107226 RepID=A0ABD3F8F9_9STRA
MATGTTERGGVGRRAPAANPGVRAAGGGSPPRQRAAAAAPPAAAAAAAIPAAPA